MSRTWWLIEHLGWMTKSSEPAAQEYIVYTLADREIRNNYYINVFILCHTLRIE